MQIFSMNEKAIRPTGVQSPMKCNQTFRVKQIRKVRDNEVNCDYNAIANSNGNIDNNRDNQDYYNQNNNDKNVTEDDDKAIINLALFFQNGHCCVADKYDFGPQNY